MNKTPLEQHESEALSQYLTMIGVKHHHGNDNMHTRSWGQKLKMKRAGFSKGFPDFVIFVEKERAKNKTPQLVFLEMKRQKGGVISEEQEEWIRCLGSITCCVHSYVAKGSEDAINFLNSEIFV